MDTKELFGLSFDGSIMKWSESLAPNGKQLLSSNGRRNLLQEKVASKTIPRNIPGSIINKSE